ncbi:heterokaryon incompatibility protein-domain-containing protein [Cercophora newfieldiana]|uniref:Heterokaryon incompatibility protein-domain-containing protein n=1 Tax=Cercophora newfieldiana TaxID=92897 RepID=A0AA39YBR3_9PEZI|nr:heterokaryon incompatibility protein-domain-containing protein [Cercophora newfieldiana]
MANQQSPLPFTNLEETTAYARQKWPAVVEPLQALPAKPYTYRPLPGDRFIRVATLHSEAPNFHLRPKISLNDVSLDSDTRYNALSYTWGIAIRDADQINAGDEAELPQPESFEIEVDGSALKVTQNLFDGLVRLSQTPGIGATPIWIDALCINQGDEDEKLLQLPLMGDIYSHAATVVIWLGADEADLAEAKYLLEHFAPRMKIYWNAGLFDMARDRLLNPNTVQKVQLSLSYNEWLAKWDAFGRFLRRRRYFTRGWIVQEVALSEDIVLLCGSHRLLWDNLFELCTFLFSSGWHLEMSNRLMVTNRVFDRDRPPRKLGDEINRLVQVRGSYKEEWGKRADKMPDLTQFLTRTLGGDTPQRRYLALACYLLTRLRDCQVTQKRDHVYAMLRLLGTSTPDEMPKKMKIIPKPAKTFSTADVYRETTQLMIENLSTLPVLALKEDLAVHTDPALPSWVPDFSYPYVPVSISWLGLGGRFHLSNPTKAPDLSRRRVEGNTLILPGSRLATIMAVCPTFSEMVRAVNLIPLIELGARAAQPYFHTGQDRLDVLWRTCIADSGPEETGSVYPAPSAMRPGFQSWLEWWLAMGLNKLAPRSPPAMAYTRAIQSATLSLENGTRNIITGIESIMQRGNGARTLQERETLTREYRAKGQEFSSAYDTVAQFRRLFLTDDGHLGVGLRSCAVGDQVWLLDGAQTPFLLREWGDVKGLKGGIEREEVRIVRRLQTLAYK